MRSVRPEARQRRRRPLLGWALVGMMAAGVPHAQTPPREIAQPAPVFTPGQIQSPTPGTPGTPATPGTPGTTGTSGAPPGIMNPGGPPRNIGHATPAPSAPTVTSVEPIQVSTGQSVTLNLTGTLFQPSMTLDFGAGITVQPKSLTLLDAGHARVAVQVAPGAPSGQHLVTAAVLVPTPAGPGAALKNTGPGYVSVVAPVTAGPVVLERVMPSAVKQGESTTLAFAGSGFTPGMSVSFGPGISAAGPVEVQSGTHATLAIRVAAQAPAMLRHPTVLISGRDVKVSPEASLTVTAVASAGPPVPQPLSYASVSVLLAVSPARLFAGESYTLTLRGLNLVPQLKVDLGTGITVNGGLRVQSASLATLDVTVARDATAGMRWLGLELPSALTPVRQDASLLVQRPVLLSHGFAPKPSACKPPQVAHTGTIVIDGPTYTGSVSDVGGTYNVPVLGDETDLTWHEANVGLADRFEVRFYSGGTLVATRALSAPAGYALPHDLKADDALIATLTQAVGSRAAKLVNVHTQGGAAAPALGWDLTWQVVGLHSFYDSCASGAAAIGTNGLHLARESLGKSQELEVEHSKPVPIQQPQTGDPLLDLPDAPTGLACGAPATPRLAIPPHLALGHGLGGANGGSNAGGGNGSGNGGGGTAQGPSNQTNLLLSNIDRQSQVNGATQTADYVYDHWQLAGTLDLSASPWSLATSGSVPSGSAQHPIETETVNNVYIDWGDGTVQPLTVQWNGTNCGSQTCFQSNTETNNPATFSLDQATNQSAFRHPYAQVGSYDVRVYVLPGNQAAANGPQPASLHAGGGGLYGKLLTRAGQAGANGAAQDALGYMLFCQTVHIQPRTDPATNGKLQLKSIEVVGFPDATAGGLGHALGGGLHTRLNGPDAGARGAAGSSPAGRSTLAEPRPPGTAAGGTAASGTKRLTPEPGAAAGSLRGLASGAAGGGSGPQFSSCDANLIGGATLKFIGEGTARVTWYEDGQVVGASDEPIGPSQSRSQQQLAPPQADAIVSDWPGLHSPALSLAEQQIGQHNLSVSAEVEADLRPTGRVLDALGEIAGTSLTTLTGKGSGNASHAGAASAALAGAPPLGLLAPKGASAAGLPPIAWVGQAPAGSPGIGLNLKLGGRALPLSTGPQNDPPDEVVSEPMAYQTTSADPSLPCTFNFPVKGGGKFVIAGLQHGGKATVQQQGGRYSGSGVLQAQLADASGTGTQPEPVTIEFKDWSMQSDGVTVAQGSFTAHPSATSVVHVPGLTAKLVTLAGTAGDQVTATLDASLANTDILPANGGASPSWKGVSAPLTPQGDWISGELSMPQLLVYDSGFLLSAASATLDLSQSQGQAGDTAYCTGQSGVGWMGVLLNRAQLTAFNFDLRNPPSVPASGWALDSYGLCGQAQFGASSFPVDQGSLAWSAINAQASQGSFKAQYSHLKVHVPWLNTDLSSNQATTQLTAGAGAGTGGIMLNLDSPSQVTLKEGPITLNTSHLSFGSMKAAGGWAVRSDTSFAFASPQGQFAGNVVLHGLDYGMSGAAALDDGSSSRHLDLGGQHGSIGGSLVDLKSVDVTVAPASSPTRLAFAFDSTLNLSKTLPSADVAVSYTITQSGQTYSGNGPVTTPFKLEKPFPDANPSVHLSMTPTYVGGTSKGKSGVLFSSNLDLGMFGGPPVSGQFVLGYVGSDDYWIARALLDLGPSGVPVAPPIINLYKIGGGMGYNVTLASFQYQDLTQAVPQDDGTLLFDASLLIGSPDHTTFGLTGDFVIKPGGADPGGRMDYHAWLLNPDWSGQSPIWGHFSYSGGVFDGTLNANFSELDGQVAIAALNDAIHMHVGGGQWYFHLGTQSNPLAGQLFFYHGQAWADLGSDGFGLGLISRLDLDAGDCNSACGYIHDDWTVMAAIATSPVSFSASANESFSLGACAAGFCINANASAAVALSLPPPYLDFNFSLGGCPPGHINVGLQVLPSLNPSVGGNVCLF